MMERNMYEMIQQMMQEDTYVFQLRAYVNVLIHHAKEGAFTHFFINFAETSVTFEQMSRIMLDLIDCQIQTNEELTVPKIFVTPNSDKSKRWREWTYLYQLMVSFYTHQYHVIFLLHNFHPKALDAEEFIHFELQNVKVPDEILQINETTLMIANSKEKFEKNKQKGWSWVKTICKN